MSLEIVCSTCQKTFTMNDDEVAYFEKMGYQNRKHCPECSAKKKAGRSTPKQMVTITCSVCGQSVQVIHPDMKMCSPCYKASKS